MTEDGFSFIWKIENFTMFPHQTGAKLVSQTFVFEMFKGVEFCLWLNFKCKYNAVRSISVFLCSTQKRGMVYPFYKVLKMNISFTLESTEPSKKITRSRSMYTNGIVSEESRGFPKFTSVEEIFANKRFYLPQDTLTLRCDIKPIETASSELTANKESEYVSQFFKKSCVSCTCIEVQRRAVSWSIRNIKERIERQEEVSMTLGSALKYAPSLKLTLILNKTSMDDYVKIIIKDTSLVGQLKRLFVKCKITVISAQKEYKVSKEDAHLFPFYPSYVWSFPPFITTRMLTDENYHYVDGTLLLRCEFAFSYKDMIHHLENNYMPFTFEKEEKKKSQLSSCFENMYATGEFCDVQLKVGGKTFPYYKLVLCARSPVFRAMFENDMKEKNLNAVEITDVDEDTLKMFLTYMHSDAMKEDLSLKEVCKLYEVADFYDVASLKRRCSTFLAPALSIESVSEVLVLADAHQDDLLMTAACDFISSHASEYFHSAQWKSLMEDHPKLSLSVMHQVWMGK